MLVSSASPYIPPADLADWHEALREIVQTGRLILGPYTEAFERAAAHVFGAPALSLSSASAGLEIALRFARVAGRKVLVPANTFIAVPNAVVRCGGVPVFIDTKPHTFAVDDDLALRAIDGGDVAALIVVHMAGFIDPWVHRLITTARSRRVFVIEDFSHAHGARLNGIMAGNLDSDCGVASLYATKIITAGTGGFLLTKHPELLTYAEAFRHHGAHRGRDLSRIAVAGGADYLMPELSAALACLQVRRLSEFVAQRRALAETYYKRLSVHARLAQIAEPGGVEAAWYKYPVFFQSDAERKRVATSLTTMGIEVGALYDRPVYYHNGRWSTAASAQCPITERNLPRQLCLPLHVRMTHEDVDMICGALLRTLGA